MFWLLRLSVVWANLIAATDYHLTSLLSHPSTLNWLPVCVGRLFPVLELCSYKMLFFLLMAGTLGWCLLLLHSFVSVFKASPSVGGGQELMKMQSVGWFFHNTITTHSDESEALSFCRELLKPPFNSLRSCMLRFPASNLYACPLVSVWASFK